MSKLYVPCQTCYNRFGKQYTYDCDTKCDYAAKVKELKQIEEEIEDMKFQEQLDYEHEEYLREMYD